MRLLDIIDLALDHCRLVRHVGVRRILRDRVDAGGTISPGLYSCAMLLSGKYSDAW
jgi:hypothetical protein